MPRQPLDAVIGYYLRHRAEVDAYLLSQESEADAFRERHSHFFPDAAAVRQRVDCLNGLHRWVRQPPADNIPSASWSAAARQ
jgi:hypothetical protein